MAFDILMPSGFSVSLTAWAKRWIPLTVAAAQISGASNILGVWNLGMTNECPGATGLISINENTLPSSNILKLRISQRIFL